MVKYFTLKNLAVALAVILWVQFSWGMILTLLVGPVVVVHGWWPRYNTELSVLFWEGFFIVQYFLIKPLLRLDQKIRVANEKARRQKEGAA